MDTALRWLARILGGLFVLQSLFFLVAPAQAVTSLGMPFLEGVGRSTQIGDFASFFGVMGVGSIAGTVPGNARLLYFPAALLGCTAIFRSVAWAAHGAAFATQAIVVEVVGTAILVAAARRLAGER